MSLRTRMPSLILGSLVLLALLGTRLPASAATSLTVTPSATGMQTGAAQRLAQLKGAVPQLEALMRETAQREQVPGYAWGLVVDGQLLHVGTGGLRELAGGEPVEQDSVFRIASMSKSFAAAAILQLRDAGKLALDDAA